MESAEKKTLWQSVRQNAASFMEAVKSGPDFLFFILVICYVASEYADRIEWVADTFPVYQFNFLHYIVLFGSGAYLCYKIAAWKKLWDKPVILIPMILAIGCLCGYFLMYLDKNWTQNKLVFTITIEIFLCLMANGKKFKKLLQYLLFIPIITLLIAGLGMLLGFTEEFTKVGQADSTHSLGIIYPNTWGYIAFQAMLLGWYLYLRKKPLITFGLFWAMGVFMYFVIGCRTIAALSLVFPPCMLLSSWMEKRERKPGGKPGIIGWFVIALPVLCFALSVGLSLNKEWVAVTFYPTPQHPNAPLRSMAMRFVQGGLALDAFGFPLFGRQMSLSAPVYLDPATGIVEDLYVMDNAYVSFLITKGMLWSAFILAWLTFAQWRGWKSKDYSILLIGSFMLIFAIMERPGMEVWYNFVLLYPLASLADPGPFIVPKAKKGHKKIKR